jgi:hypothetical protein
MIQISLHGVYSKMFLKYVLTNVLKTIRFEFHNNRFKYIFWENIQDN